MKYIASRTEQEERTHGIKETGPGFSANIKFIFLVRSSIFCSNLIGSIEYKTSMKQKSKNKTGEVESILQGVCEHVIPKLSNVVFLYM